jgi:hypothetical protein
MNLPLNRAKSWSLCLLAALVVTTGCPSFHGKGGIISQAVLDDLYKRHASANCPIKDRQDWLEDCYYPFYEGRGVKDENACPDECRGGRN